MSHNLTISAVGDISFEGKWADSPSDQLFTFISSAFAGADLVVGNLEGPLFDEHNPVAGKTTFRGSTLWAEVLVKTGFRVLSLANNHMMDHGEEGLLQTMHTLDNEGLIYVGAGKDLETACAPVFVDILSMSIAFLGRSSVIVSSPSYASKDTAGVAFFDVEETKQRIRGCRQKADFVILMMHWGLEEYRYPTPEQRKVARELIQAGADLILGHHPHVIQGVEILEHGLGCYSLGNFLFDEFWWTLADNQGNAQRFYSSLTADNRKSGILTVRFSTKGVESYEFIPTLIAQDGILRLDKTFERKKEFNILCRRLQKPWYGLFWKFYSFKQECTLRLWPRLKNMMKWSKLKKMRLHHLLEFAQLLRKSAKIVEQKTTNPYE